MVLEQLNIHRSIKKERRKEKKKKQRNKEPQPKLILFAKINSK